MQVAYILEKSRQTDHEVFLVHARARETCKHPLPDAIMSQLNHLVEGRCLKAWDMHADTQQTMQYSAQQASLLKRRM